MVSVNEAEPTPEAAKRTWPSAPARSSKLSKPLLVESTMTRGSAAALPIQLNSLRSNLMPSRCRIWA